MIGYSSWAQLKDIAPSFGVACVMMAAVYALKLTGLSPLSLLIVQLAAGARSLSRRTRLLLYSLKVGAAVAASVLLLALLPATFPPGGGPGASVPFYQKAQQITHGLNRITYNFTDWEVFFNDKEKE